MKKTNKMFRASDELWHEFNAACKANGRTRGEVLREKMREYVETGKWETKKEVTK